ncbi:MAG: DNA (cytosine-5-)-methyltransferase, partial [Pseudopedobacter saltans]
MRILSLFDGMSCGRAAMEWLGIPVVDYYAAEIDKFAIRIAQNNHPTTTQLGDVKIVRQMAEAGLFGRIDLLIGGSPCTDLSFAGKQVGMSTKTKEDITTLERYKQLVAENFEFEGQSYLFWEWVWIREILQKQNPDLKYFLENVRMSKKWLGVFNIAVGTEPVCINSALKPAQNRVR